MATSIYKEVFLLYCNRVVVCVKGRKLPRVREIFKYPGEDDNSLV
jgi:hypothetical protein